MFWNAVTSGLAVLGNWQTYAAGSLYLSLTLLPLILLGRLVLATGRASGVVGCLSVLVQPFFQVFALCVFVTTMFPILLGFSSDAAWSLPWVMAATMPGSFFFLLVKLLLATIVLSFIPIIGRINAVHTTVIGGIVLILTIGIAVSANPNLDAHNMRLWPGFWFAVGLLIVGAAMAWLGALAAAVLGMAIDSKFEGVGQAVAVPLVATFGFIPLFIYAAWLGTQLSRL